MTVNFVRHVDKAAHDEAYRGTLSRFAAFNSTGAFPRAYGAFDMVPFNQGGTTKGYVRGLAVRELVKAAEASGKPFADITVLDAGSGLGDLTTYLACLGFRVFGVDISEEAVRSGERLAAIVGVQERARFLANSLESMALPDASVDFIIGFAALHHFIKYPGVPDEFHRVMKSGALGFFADAWGENRIFRLFHNRERMRRLGDVSLTRGMVRQYFRRFDVDLRPTDWFVMLDKLLVRGLPRRVVRRLSRVHFALDRQIPADNSLALRLAGSVRTRIRKPHA